MSRIDFQSEELRDKILGELGIQLASKSVEGYVDEDVWEDVGHVEAVFLLDARGDGEDFFTELLNVFITFDFVREVERHLTVPVDEVGLTRSEDPRRDDFVLRVVVDVIFGVRRAGEPTTEACDFGERFSGAGTL